MKVCVDFDGVIHAYRPHARGLGPCVIGDKPVPGALDFLTTLVESGAEVWVYTSRLFDSDNATGVIVDWLSLYGLPDDVTLRLQFTGRKVPADVYIDDRAWRFEGTFPTHEELRAFRPWNDEVDSCSQQQSEDGSASASAAA